MHSDGSTDHLRRLDASVGSVKPAQQDGRVAVFEDLVSLAVASLSRGLANFRCRRPAAGLAVYGVGPRTDVLRSDLGHDGGDQLVPRREQVIHCPVMPVDCHDPRC